MQGASLIWEFLREGGVPYTVGQHRPTSTVRDQASALGVSGRDGAEVVTCLLDGEPIDAVIPASLTMNLNRLLALAGGSEIRLATEQEVEQRHPKREPETMPNLNRLYRPSVFVDVALVSAPQIVFTVGRVPEAICIRWADFAKRVRPIVGKFAEPSLMWARCRLSPRE
jgi:prolyl-tRNA editing enzyme YbaK/EbsC (Cys-tRNA(Pro) deacylase)